MNYDPRFAAVCGDARLPSYPTGRLIERKPPAVEKNPSGDLDAQRLRHFLASKLSNDHIIMVSNRQPFSHDVVNWRPKNNARYQRAVDLSLALIALTTQREFSSNFKPLRSL